MIEILTELHIALEIKVLNSNEFTTDIGNKGMQDLAKVDELDITYLQYTGNSYCISGNVHRLFKIAKNTSKICIWFNNQICIYSDGEFLQVTDIIYLKKIEHILNKFNFLVVRFSNDTNLKISFNTQIDSRLQIDVNLRVLFIPTPTNNIILTSNVKVSLLLAKDHIQLTSRGRIIPQLLAFYITVLIITYSCYVKPMLLKKAFIKEEVIYWSRICQNSPKYKRKPSVISELPPNAVQVNEYIYTEKVNTEQINEYYVNYTNGIIYGCTESNNQFTKLGFLKLFLEISNLCIPCCFIQNQSNTPTYKTCIEGKTEESIIEDMEPNPYMLNFNKILTTNKISLLSDGINWLMNKDSVVNLEYKRIIFALNYSVIRSISKSIIRIKTFDDLYDNAYKRKMIIINKDIIYFHPSLVYEDISDVSIGILIQEILHGISEINKRLNQDKIIVKNDPEKCMKLLSFISYLTNDKTIFEENGLTLKQNGFYMDGKMLNIRPSTKYFIVLPTIVTYDYGTRSRYIRNFFKKFFHNIHCEEKTIND